MSHHLVLGAGGVGRTATAALVSAGHTVTLASRSGRVTERPWQDAHPDAVEVVAATLAAAEATGAGLVIIGNLYGYGRVQSPMKEDDPMRPAGHKGALRADMWRS